MTIAVRQFVQVQAGGKIELVSPELVAGQRAEVIVLTDVTEEAMMRAELVRRWQALFSAIQALPEAQTITDEEIDAEIAAYRAGQ